MCKSGNLIDTIMPKLPTWSSPGVHLTFTWPSDHHLTSDPYLTFSSFKLNKSCVVGGGWVVVGKPITNPISGSSLDIWRWTWEMTRAWQWQCNALWSNGTFKLFAPKMPTNNSYSDYLFMFNSILALMINKSVKRVNLELTTKTEKMYK